MSRSHRNRLALGVAYVGGAVLVTFAALRAEEGRTTPAIAHATATAAGVNPHAGPDALAHAAGEMAAAAENWWTALTPEQQAKAGFGFDDANRFDWHFIPRERKGLAYKDMTSAQRALAHGLLASGLSTRGYIQANTIMSLDAILKEMEPGPPKTPYRDPENYSFTLFGKPGDKATWGWRVEGHHLSLNFTIIGGKSVAGGPVFFGTNPAEVREGPRKGLRVLAVEDDAGFALVKSLNDDLRKKATIAAEAPKEVYTSNERKANPGPPKGVAFSELNPQQQQSIKDLTVHYANRLRPALATDDIAKIEQAGWDKVHFAWAGGTEPGQAHYYRLHGPTFLVEFDDTQNNANHVHTVWRDAANDFGEDLLKQHYADHAHDAEHGHDAK